MGTQYRRLENGVENYDYSRTRQPNVVNFGPGPAFRPAQSTFSDVHISGAKGRCPLQISHLLEDDQRLLMHTSLGMGLPQQFLTPKIRKLAKNCVYFSLYRRGLLGARELRQSANVSTW